MGRGPHRAFCWLSRPLYTYIAQDNPAAAEKTLQAIYDKAERLRTFPELGYRLSLHTDKEIRVLLFGHYRIAYVLKPDKVIDILGVFHGAMEIERYLT